MMRRLRLSILALACLPAPGIVHEAAALEPERYTVYCADERIEISFWDLEQMKVRRGSDVCQLASYTSWSDADRFVTRNFGDEGADCGC